MTVYLQSPRSIWDYFDSHPLTEDDYICLDITTHNRISTHILSQRMTISPLRQKCRSKSISTHILSQRMTLWSHGRRGEHTQFRLTSSHRGWQAIICIHNFCSFISTHILSQRMTQWHIFQHDSDFSISTHILSQRMTAILCVNYALWHIISFFYKPNLLF